MIVPRDETLTVNSRFGSPSVTVCLFLTVELLIGALLSGFLAVLEIVKSRLPKPPRNLTGDVVLVAGASSSLGKSIAEEFAKNGCTVICVDRESKSVEEIASGLQARYPVVEEVRPSHRKDDSPRPTAAITAYKCDLLNSEDIRRTAQKIKNEVGRVDVLVTCVGNMDQDIFDTASKTLMSHFWTVLAFLPLMLYRERAHIVGVTPVASNCDAYHGSRAAIASLMESLTEQLSNHSSQLTFLAFSPIAKYSTPTETEKEVAVDIVQAVRTDWNSLRVGWISRFSYRISCAMYNCITSFTEWIGSQGCDYPA
ncbi:PREDICTED: estradiol 17-beta-dehydrogenase 11-like [Dufourea novaeangliae]|uniref:Estradiol 17-beta-dehydrogenase 11 n=1 Tax=Dufourea novaeangliae TaxID=178035 RepID=A0A154PP71_DUFNO|nr:PREDICTED: estradiol 17-beta-dehydrogenase 11-like [Dufourea novaeangliae]KZC13669.1 Estradiol 17-beta-dehydrogenase 11 [Dufourea novaeangliae]